MLWLVTTTGQCNLQCKYCGGSFSSEHVPYIIKYSLESLKKLIENDPDSTVIFYGGEPLINYRFIMSVLDNIKAKRYGIQTNGTLVHLLPREYWSRMNVVLLSIDGPPEITNKYRGAKVYDHVVNALQYLKSFCNCEIIARMTVTADSRVYRDVTHLLNLGFDKVHWQLNVIWSEKWDVKKWADDEYLPDLQLLIKLFINNLRNGKVLKIIPILGILNSILFKPFDHIPCGAGRYSFTVNTDGRILSCPIAVREDWAIVGNIKTGIKYNETLPKKCMDCQYLRYCGGRCLYAHKENYWGEAFDNICYVTRKTIDLIFKIVPEVKELIKNGRIHETDLYYDPLKDSTEVIP